VLIGLVVLTALAGVLGRGAPSWTTAGGESKRVRVEYNRFMRPECVGRLPSRVGLAGRPPIECTTFVYP
jgi:hypothetical protein